MIAVKPPTLSFVRAFVLPIAALLFSACGATPGSPTAAPAPTLAPADTLAPATASPVPPTATASPIPPTETPMPTPDAAATAAAEATAAMAPILEGIDRDLQKYGFSTEVGRLGWAHDPITIEPDGYWEDEIRMDYPDVTASDFVLQADITWSTTTGLASCGFVVRADSDFEHGDSYRLYLIRLGPLWDLELFKAGQFYSNASGLRDALALDDELDSTNRVAFIAQGSKFAVYANGQDQGTVTDTRLTSGAAAFLGDQESGRTTCTFENAWLWILDE